MPEPRFKRVHSSEVAAFEFGTDAPGVRIRKLIDEESDGAPNYNLRMIEIDPGGNTPEHEHENEHENYILEGRGEVLFEGTYYPVGPGDVVFVPGGSVHQYRNTGEAPFRFLCGVPTSKVLSAPGA